MLMEFFLMIFNFPNLLNYYLKLTTSEYTHFLFKFYLYDLILKSFDLLFEMQKSNFSLNCQLIYWFIKA